ncbi:alpha/beta hydrolase [Kribbella sp. NPDC051952]|uniref:alpha/beta fold hydrolase n=1 Tax=Kribbella sp. NPDC051952 TaxID=3154851 RepID=UPI0034171084
MTTFVLVHGAWHGSWAWDRVVPVLEDAGARTVNVTLPWEGAPGLHDHVAEVVSALDGLTAADDVVLVGHSYAGLVVREAADQRSTLVRQLILVDGWAASDGAGLFDLAPAPFVDAVRRSAEANADNRYIPAPAAGAFGITDPGDVDWLSQRLVPQPLRTFTEATRLTGAVDQIPGTAIYCRPQVYQFEQFAKEIGYRTVPIDGPHNVMLTHPHELTALLLDVHPATTGDRSIG